MWVHLAVATATVFGKKNEVLVNLLSSVFLVVKIWTMILFALFAQLTWVDLIVAWMILLLLPAMAEGTSILVLAPI
tara:strand:- start:868 stop:1095 length:228 start_codon:yes stop_codon:yes gene_type:complete